MKRKVILSIIILFTIISCNTGRKTGVETDYTQVDFVKVIDSLTYYWHRYAKDSTLVTIKSNDTILSEYIIVVDYVDAFCDKNGEIGIDCKDSVFVIILTNFDTSKRNYVWDLNNNENADHTPGTIIMAPEDYYMLFNPSE